MQDLAKTTPGTITARTTGNTNPLLAYLGSLSAGPSRRSMGSALIRLVEVMTGQPLEGDHARRIEAAAVFPWHELRAEHTARLRSELGDMDLAPSTANRMLAALRGVMRWCWRLGLLERDELERAIDFEPLRGSRVQSGRALPQSELASLFRACADGTTAGRRDAAAIALLYGLRRAEVVGLDLADYNPTEGELRVMGKGDKERMVPITNGSKAALDAWIEVRGNEPGPLLTRVVRNGGATLEGITAQSVYKALERRAKRAGVANFAPHDLRRTFAGDALDSGADLVTVQALMGHADPRTTAKYDRRGERAKRAAVALMPVPYAGAGVSR